MTLPMTSAGPVDRPGMMAITMAGFGTRFTKAGYTVPKYRIEALGRPLFDWSMLALSAFRDAGWDFAFAVRSADRAADFISERCRVLGLTVHHILELPEPTDGQATTAQLLARQDRAGRPLAVFNIDTFVRPGAMAPQGIPPGCGGWVPCFAGQGEGWSFVRLDQGGRAVELREKTRISPHATVGFYWFASSGLYLDAYDRFFAAGGAEKGERYIAPLYNRLIADGQEVRISQLGLDEVGLLGTPEQVEAFQARPPPAALAAVKSL